MYRGKYAFRKKNRRHVFPGILLALFLLIFLTNIDAVMAYMFKQSVEVTNILEPAQVSVEVGESFDHQTKSNVYFENTSTIPVYIRATIAEYWMKGDAYVAQPEGAKANITWSGDSKWLKNGDLYYYSEPVAVGGKTSTLINTVTVTMPEGYTYHMDIYAEAIQAEGTNNNKPAVTDAWDVSVEDGKLVFDS